LSRSIQKWRQVVQESKYNEIEGNYVQKCKGIELLLQKMIDSKFKCAVLKAFGLWRKYMQDLNLSKISDHLNEKCRVVELLQFKVSSMTEDVKRQKEHFQQLQESVLETKVVNGFMNLEEYDAATKKLACFEKENAELRVQIELVNSQLDGVVAQLAAKDMSLSTLEERIQSKSSAIMLLESTVSELRQKHDSLEKEVALGAAHSSLLFKELKETRSKLTLSSEEKFQLQEQHLGLVQRLDGTSGSIRTLWTERESDMEV
jgi:chromosome segregation ATPase